MQEYQVTLEGETIAARRGRSSCWRRRTRSRPKAPIRCPRRSSTASCSRSRSAIRRIADEIGDRRADDARASAATQLPLEAVSECIEASELLALQELASQVRVDERVIDYAVRIGRATRGGLGLAAGSGPRGAIALVRAARAAALLDGRDFVTPDDVKRCACRRCATACCSRPTRSSKAARVDELLVDLLATVEAPRALSRREPATDALASCRPAPVAVVARWRLARRRTARAASRRALVGVDRRAAAVAALGAGARRRRRGASRRAWRAAPLRWQRAAAAGARRSACDACRRQPRQRGRRGAGGRALRPRRSVVRRRRPAARRRRRAGSS